jgi:hypothetical protein
MTRGQIYTRFFWQSAIVTFGMWFLFGFDWLGVPITGEMNFVTLEPFTWFDHMQDTVKLFAVSTFAGFYGQVIGYWGLRWMLG